jgi:hypothetical protein
MQLVAFRPHLTISSPKERRGRTLEFFSAAVIKHFNFVAVLGIISLTMWKN